MDEDIKSCSVEGTRMHVFVEIIEYRQACPPLARLVLGLLILKHSTNLSDEELKKEFFENVYPPRRTFCGFDHFLTADALNSSTLTKVRQRLGADFFREMEFLTYRALVEKKIIRGRGVLCDATVIPEKISYPNDIGLLEKCRVKVAEFVKSAGGRPWV